MEPIEVFSTIINSFISRPLQVIGFNFTNPHYKVTLLTIFVIIYAFSFSVFSVTTCFEVDLSQCTQGLVMSMIGVQLAVKAFFVCISHVGLNRNISLIKELYEANKIDSESKEDLRKVAMINIFLAKFFIFCIVGTIIVLFFGPIPIYLFTGQIILPLPVKLPILATNTIFGYIFHLVYHEFGLINAALGLATIDVVMITMTIHIWPMTRILERAVADLNLGTQSIRADSVKNSVWLKLRMRNIILMHKELFFYVRGVLDMSYALSTAEIYADQAGLIILVYCILKLKWIPGVLIFFCGIFKLFAICMIGTAVDFFNNKAYEALANIDCTMLPEDEKKNIMIMLHASQHPPTMRAGLVPMNLSLFVEVIKTIYTLGMLLLESID